VRLKGKNSLYIDRLLSMEGSINIKLGGMMWWNEMQPLNYPKSCERFPGGSFKVK